MRQIGRLDAKRKIHNTAGRIFSVQFTKRDGTLRDMVCRLGVKKKLKGGDRAYNPDDYNLVFVYDMQKEGYRSIPFDRLHLLNINGQSYEVLTQD